MDKEQKRILGHIPHLEEIDGWLLLVEAAELFRCSDSIASPHPIVCEIGTWKGRSSYVLASAMKGKGGVLYSVDPFNGEGDTASKDAYRAELKRLGTTLVKNFEATMEQYGLRQYINVFPMLSEQARAVFTEPKIDLLFIDGNHEYDWVKKDYELWTPLIPSGGIIALHDVKASHVDGPGRIMQEYIANSPQWKDARVVGEMGVAVKA
ncbi:MAG: class I SAM-dependent methyltransferase [Candidatus Liptonbacteria bacterium]|nr:class I SAM-dependent methyltransferase [Candidatus Liptonbacteria bacterium]